MNLKLKKVLKKEFKKLYLQRSKILPLKNFHFVKYVSLKKALCLCINGVQIKLIFRGIKIKQKNKS